MSTNREGETAVTIPLQYNEAVSDILYLSLVPDISGAFFS